MAAPPVRRLSRRTWRTQVSQRRTNNTVPFHEEKNLGVFMAFQLENMDLSITYIPEDIIKEILLRLPVKSLSRFRCVSKTWLFIISSYKFAKEQLKISTKNNVYLHDRLICGATNLPMDFHTCSIQSLVHGCNSAGTQIYPPTNENNLLFDPARVDNYPFSKQDGDIWIVSSCNGLVCLYFHLIDTLVLWNPTTGKLKNLPQSTIVSDISVFAFGYDELHDDYKVVEFSHATDEHGRTFLSGGRVVKVYSLRNNSWKTLSNWPGGGHIPGFGMGKFLDGNIHWLVRKFSDDVNWAMVSHDLDTDTFTVSRLPNEEKKADVGDIFIHVVLEILEGRLALYFHCPFHMDIWVMKDKSWTKSFRIPYLLELSFLESHFLGPIPLFYWAEYGKILINYKTSVGIHDLNIPQPPQFGKEFLVECTTYFESLVSPNLDDEVILGRTMPSEIITEILSRLPVRSLLKFKSVCKEWRSLISSSRFVMAHLKTSITRNDVVLLFGPTTNNNQELYYCSTNHMIEGSVFSGPTYAGFTGTVYSVAADDEKFPFYFFRLDSSGVDTPEAAAEIRLVGSCNGLVCLSLSRKLILANPATDKEKILPNSSTNDERYNLLSYSFGYDQVHDDYKVVEIDQYHVESTLVQVYSMRTNSWEALLNWPGGDAGLRPSKFLNGSLHWSVRDLLDGFVVRRFIISLDLATLTFSHSPLPLNIDLVDIDDDAFVEVDIVGGCLAVYITHRADMDLWVMKEYGVIESWTRVVRVDLGNYHGFARPRPLFFAENGKILLNYGSSLKIYDSSNPQHHVFDTDLRLDAIAFVETLVPVTLEQGEEPLMAMAGKVGSGRN